MREKIDKMLCDERTGNIIRSLEDLKNCIREVRSEAQANNTVLQTQLTKIMTNDLAHTDIRMQGLEQNMAVLTTRFTSLYKKVMESTTNKKIILSIFGNVIAIILILIQLLAGRI
ncbi:MAG: hypothetical protein WC307_06670 [Candidatus Nanoarchaeia archaeon]|jgi:hypothetical protein